jgi:hypothetical protein
MVVVVGDGASTIHDYPVTERGFTCVAAVEDAVLTVGERIGGEASRRLDVVRVEVSALARVVVIDIDRGRVENGKKRSLRRLNLQFCLDESSVRLSYAKRGIELSTVRHTNSERQQEYRFTSKFRRQKRSTEGDESEQFLE